MSAKPSLDNIARSLRKLKKYSLALSKECIPIMQEIEDRRSDIVRNFVKKHVIIGNDESSSLKPSRDEAQTILQNTAFLITKDARHVIDEIEQFEIYILKGKEKLRQNGDKYPFLIKLWCGDIYDEKEVNAIQKLSKEIKDTKDKIDEDYVIEQAMVVGSKFFD